MWFQVVGHLPPPQPRQATLEIVHFRGKNKVRLSGHISVVSVNLPRKMYATDVSRQIGFHTPQKMPSLRPLHSYMQAFIRDIFYNFDWISDGGF